MSVPSLCFAQGFGVHVAGKGIWFILHKPREPGIFILEGEKIPFSIVSVVSYYKFEL